LCDTSAKESNKGKNFGSFGVNLLKNELSILFTFYINDLHLNSFLIAPSAKLCLW